MFFNFGPFGFGVGDRPRQPPRQNSQNNQNGGFFGGINEFLPEGFMNPFHQPRRQNENQQPGPQPTFQAGSAKKKSEKNKKSGQKKQEEIVYNENTGMYWKKKANELFKSNRNQEALELYNKAIEINNTESIFYSNRARCLKKMKRYQEALKDAQQAVELDVQNIKGHLLSGQILAQIGKANKDLKKVQNAIIRLTKALTLCVGQKKTDQFQHEISQYIYRAKKLLWYLKLEEVRAKRIKAISQYKDYIEKDDTIQKQQKVNRINQFIEASNEQIVFHIPDYLCCRITLDLMEDPVVTDSGQVYERTAIKQHIDRNGKTDPFTRKPISGNLYPCIAIKKAIQDFLHKNPWSYEYIQGEDYNDISF